MGKLTAKEVQAKAKGEPGHFSDGGGLWFVVPKSGVSYWALKYTSNGKRRQMTLGKLAALTLAEARTEAENKKAEVRSGIDPIAERKRDQSATIKTVNQLFEDWFTDLSKRLKHPNIPKRIYTKEIAPMIGELSPKQVNPRDIRAIIQKVANSDRPTIANDTLMYCKQLFNHGIKLDIVQGNPASAFNYSDAGGVEKSRDRILDIEELTETFKVFRKNKDQFTRDNYLACALLLTLGVRKTELTASKWPEFDFERKVWHLPEERSKSGVAIIIPLPDIAVKWLEELKIRAFDSEYVFPNRRSSKRGHISPDTINAAIAKLVRQEKLSHFTVHDLRRSCRSLLAVAGIPGHVAERCLNHKLKGVEAIYNRYDYFDERKEALDKISALIAPMVNGRSNIKTLKLKVG